MLIVKKMGLHDGIPTCGEFRLVVFEESTVCAVLEFGFHGGRPCFDFEVSMVQAAHVPWRLPTAIAIREPNIEQSSILGLLGTSGG